MATYSHDGRWLALSERVIVDGVNSNDVQSVKVMAADGSQGQRIFFEPKTAAMSPKWSPDDQSIVVGVGRGLPRSTTAR
jgi:Tol biopolymer transport system component